MKCESCILEKKHYALKLCRSCYDKKRRKEHLNIEREAGRRSYRKNKDTVIKRVLKWREF